MSLRTMSQHGEVTADWRDPAEAGQSHDQQTRFIFDCKGIASSLLYLLLAMTSEMLKYGLILIILSIVAYVNILPNKLFFDDEELIYKNTYVSDFKYFPKYFTTNMIAGAGKLSNMYRPVLTTSFALDHLIWGNNPLGYHLTSIFLHTLNSVLVFVLINLLFGNLYLGFLTSLFFAVHPALSEAVIYASGRTDPLYSFFGLSSIIFYLLSFKNKKLNIYLYIFSLILFLLSLLSKETAVIIPLVLGLSVATTTLSKKFPITFKYLLLIPYFIISVIYFLLRLTILNFANTLNFYSGLNTSDVISQYSHNIFVRIFTFSKVFFEYIFLFFFPKDLIIARQTQIIASLLNPWVICFILLLIILTIITVKQWNHGRKIFAFSLIWFFVSLLPASGVIPINNIIAEHYLYLPSVGFFLILAFLIISFYQKITNVYLKYSFIIFITIIIIIFSIRTIIRTFDWRDPITFYTLSIKQSPWNIPMIHNLAMAYQENGQTQKAIDEYKYIISKADVYPNTHHNLANVYEELGMYKEAETEYLNALKIDPHFYFSLYGLANLYQKTGEKEKLKRVLDKLNQINR